MYDRNSELHADTGLTAKAGPQIGSMQRSTHYSVECVRDGKSLWTEEFDNLVVTAGLNDSLEKQFKASAYTAAWYVGLADGTPTFAAGDTMNGAHAGWTEITAYSEANRQTLTLPAVPFSGGTVNNSASKAVFTINGSTTIGGAFVVDNNTKGGTTGVLYGGGAFSQDRSLIANDVLNVTITLTATAS